MIGKSVKICAVFLAALALGAFLQSSGNFPDPDSFYHAGMASLIKDSGLPHAFPWLQLTELKERYADHHLLYHLFLVPFLNFADPLSVVRWASIFFSALAITAFYSIQKRAGMRFAGVATALLMASSTFIFRVNLAKAVGPVILLFLFVLWAVLKRRNILLFALSAVYPWLYAGWPLVLGLVFVNISVSGIFSFLENPSPGLKLFFRKIIAGENIKALLAASGGLALGLIVNPYFPDNLWFTWMQAVKIGLFNYQGNISVGQEWYPIGYGELLGNTALPVIFFLAALGLFFRPLFKGMPARGADNLKMMREAAALIILSGIFLVLTVKSRRSAEYFVPLFLLASSWLAEIGLRARPGQAKELAAYLGAEHWRKIFAAFVLLSSFFIAGRDIFAAKKYFDKGFDPAAYKGAAGAIASVSGSGDIVFHSDWDEFPMLFYWNRNQYYLAGLDPSFFYEFDKDRYKEWFAAINGRYDGDVYELISKRFGAKMVFASARHPKFRAQLKEDGRFLLVYEDSQASIFKLK